MAKEINVESIVEACINDIAEEAVKNVLNRHAGYGIDEGVKTVIIEEARKIAATEDIRERIKSQMLYWIKE